MKFQHKIMMLAALVSFAAVNADIPADVWKNAYKIRQLKWNALSAADKLKVVSKAKNSGLPAFRDAAQAVLAQAQAGHVQALEEALEAPLKPLRKKRPARIEEAANAVAQTLSTDPSERAEGEEAVREIEEKEGVKIDVEPVKEAVEAEGSAGSSSEGGSRLNDDAFEILGLDEATATQDQVRDAYNRLIMGKSPRDPQYASIIRAFGMARDAVRERSAQ